VRSMGRNRGPSCPRGDDPEPVGNKTIPAEDSREVKRATAGSREQPQSANIRLVSRSSTVRTNGQELFYEVHGEGPALVLVMSVGYHSSLWMLQLVPVLATRSRVSLLYNRDADRSPEPTTRTG
jgi:hypothetical protein